MTEVGDVIESPDGDPRKQGTITNAVAVKTSYGPIELQSPGRIDPETYDPPGALLEAHRKTDLLIASNLDQAIGMFYGSGGEVEKLIREVRETQ